MAKTPRQLKTAKSAKALPERGKCGRSIFQLALRRIAGFLNTQRDRDIERFINARGGVINDALDRELNRHFDRM